MPLSAILLVFKFLMFSFLQVCKFTDLQVHNSMDCPYFYGLSVKISDLLHMIISSTKCSLWVPGLAVRTASQVQDIDIIMMLGSPCNH